MAAPQRQLTAPPRRGNGEDGIMKAEGVSGEDGDDKEENEEDAENDEEEGEKQEAGSAKSVQPQHQLQKKQKNKKKQGRAKKQQKLLAQAPKDDGALALEATAADADDGGESFSMDSFRKLVEQNMIPKSLEEALKDALVDVNNASQDEKDVVERVKSRFEKLMSLEPNDQVDMLMEEIALAFPALAEQFRRKRDEGAKLRAQGSGATVYLFIQRANPAVCPPWVPACMTVREREDGLVHLSDGVEGGSPGVALVDAFHDVVALLLAQLARAPVTGARRDRDVAATRGARHLTGSKRDEIARLFFRTEAVFGLLHLTARSILGPTWRHPRVAVVRDHADSIVTMAENWLALINDLMQDVQRLPVHQEANPAKQRLHLTLHLLREMATQELHSLFAVPRQASMPLLSNGLKRLSCQVDYAACLYSKLSPAMDEHFNRMAPSAGARFRDQFANDRYFCDSVLVPELRAALARFHPAASAADTVGAADALLSDLRRLSKVTLGHRDLAADMSIYVGDGNPAAVDPEDPTGSRLQQTFLAGQPCLRAANGAQEVVYALTRDNLRLALGHTLRKRDGVRVAACLEELLAGFTAITTLAKSVQLGTFSLDPHLFTYHPSLNVIERMDHIWNCESGPGLYLDLLAPNDELALSLHRARCLRRDVKVVELVDAILDAIEIWSLQLPATFGKPLTDALLDMWTVANSRYCIIEPVKAAYLSMVRVVRMMATLAARGEGIITAMVEGLAEDWHSAAQTAALASEKASRNRSALADQAMFALLNESELERQQRVNALRRKAKAASVKDFPAAGLSSKGASEHPFGEPPGDAASVPPAALTSNLPEFFREARLENVLRGIDLTIKALLCAEPAGALRSSHAWSVDKDFQGLWKTASLLNLQQVVGRIGDGYLRVTSDAAPPSPRQFIFGHVDALRLAVELALGTALTHYSVTTAADGYQSSPLRSADTRTHRLDVLLSYLVCSETVPASMQCIAAHYRDVVAVLALGNASVNYLYTADSKLLAGPSAILVHYLKTVDEADPLGIVGARAGDHAVKWPFLREKHVALLDRTVRFVGAMLDCLLRGGGGGNLPYADERGLVQPFLDLLGANDCDDATWEQDDIDTSGEPVTNLADREASGVAFGDLVDGVHGRKEAARAISEVSAWTALLRLALLEGPDRVRRQQRRNGSLNNVLLYLNRMQAILSDRPDVIDAASVYDACLDALNLVWRAIKELLVALLVHCSPFQLAAELERANNPARLLYALAALDRGGFPALPELDASLAGWLRCIHAVLTYPTPLDASSPAADSAEHSLRALVGRVHAHCLLWRNLGDLDSVVGPGGRAQTRSELISDGLAMIADVQADYLYPALSFLLRLARTTVPDAHVPKRSRL